ncbi:hypothetical protein ACTMU2_17030 [Cupriavidus basilensis]
MGETAAASVAGIRGEWFAFGKEHSIVAKKMDVSSVYEEVRAGLDSMTDKKYEWWKKKMVRLLQSCRVHEGWSSAKRFIWRASAILARF